MWSMNPVCDKRRPRVANEEDRKRRRLLTSLRSIRRFASTNTSVHARGPAPPRPARGGGRQLSRRARRRPRPGDSGRAEGAAANRSASTRKACGGSQGDDGPDSIADQRADRDAQHSAERADDDRSELGDIVSPLSSVAPASRNAQDGTIAPKDRPRQIDGEDDPHQSGRDELGRGRCDGAVRRAASGGSSRHGTRP